MNAQAQPRWLSVLLSLALLVTPITGFAREPGLVGAGPGVPHRLPVPDLGRPSNPEGIPGGGWNETDLRGVNQPPVANAGVDQVVHRLTVVTLDGSGSWDLDGDLLLTYVWTQTGGPAVTLSDTTAVKPTFTAPGIAATLTFSLVVFDSLGLRSTTPDVVAIVVRAYHAYLPLTLQ